jgi:hypothetical protein
VAMGRFSGSHVPAWRIVAHCVGAKHVPRVLCSMWQQSAIADCACKDSVRMFFCCTDTGRCTIYVVISTNLLAFHTSWSICLVAQISAAKAQGLSVLQCAVTDAQAARDVDRVLSAVQQLQWRPLA